MDPATDVGYNGHNGPEGARTPVSRLTVGRPTTERPGLALGGDRVTARSPFALYGQSSIAYLPVKINRVDFFPLTGYSAGDKGEEMAETPARPKHRSPVYPSIDLKAAIGRTTELWNHAQRHFVPVADAMRLWGYSPKSSGGIQTIAALKRFGLVADQGAGAGRRIGVSDMGRAIVTDDVNSQRRLDLLKEAALAPKIHQDLWAEFGAPIPPESTLRWHLVNERAFSEAAARELIAEYQETLAYSGLSQGDDSIPTAYQDSEETSEVMPGTVETDQRVTLAKTGHGVMGRAQQQFGTALQLPIGPGKWASLQGPFPVTGEQWDLMLAVLQAMKPGLVADPALASDDPGGPS